MYYSVGVKNKIKTVMSTVQTEKIILSVSGT